MKINYFLVILSVILLLTNVINCKKSSDNKTADEKKSYFSSDLKGKVSYSIGHNIGNSISRSLIEIDEKIFLDGFREGMSGSKSKYSSDEIKMIMMDMEKVLTEKKQDEADFNKKAGMEYLEKNKSDANIIVLPSGVQYKILKEGKGNKPKLSEVVKVNYIGKLIDGTEFESSYNLGRPAAYPVSGVIKGWQEALQLMSVGSKWEIFIPSELGYGEMGSQGVIPPNSVLIFEVELVGIEPN
ncbi:MAG: FKBP-type peptidyl-prolyl cis-trans isomerase [Spirochaetes bacterium]|nr:FKBP-type peptidyl-prolyl cis-trans isomerase [Spirochaetota bacterium]